MADEYINRNTFLAKTRALYCKNCIRRTDSKGKTVYEIGEAPCRACYVDDILDDVENSPVADVVEVVRCKDCVNYVESEEVNGEKMCVRDADWSIEDGCYYGFTEYPSPDWFCADGKKREES